MEAFKLPKVESKNGILEYISSQAGKYFEYKTPKADIATLQKFSQTLNKVLVSDKPQNFEYPFFNFHRVLDNAGQFGYIIGPLPDSFIPGSKEYFDMLTLSDQFFVIIKIAEGIKFLNDRNIYHGDIQISNMIFDSFCIPRFINFVLLQNQKNIPEIAKNKDARDFCALIRKLWEKYEFISKLPAKKKIISIGQIIQFFFNNFNSIQEEFIAQNSDPNCSQNMKNTYFDFQSFLSIEENFLNSVSNPISNPFSGVPMSAQSKPISDLNSNPEISMSTQQKAKKSKKNPKQTPISDSNPFSGVPMSAQSEPISDLNSNPEISMSTQKKAKKSKKNPKQTPISDPNPNMVDPSQQDELLHYKTNFDGLSFLMTKPLTPEEANYQLQLAERLIQDQDLKIDIIQSRIQYFENMIQQLS